MPPPHIVAMIHSLSESQLDEVIRETTKIINIKKMARLGVLKQFNAYARSLLEDKESLDQLPACPAEVTDLLAWKKNHVTKEHLQPGDQGTF